MVWLLLAGLEGLGFAFCCYNVLFGVAIRITVLLLCVFFGLGFWFGIVFCMFVCLLFMFACGVLFVV